VPYTTARIWDVAVIARDQVNVEVEDRLPRGRPDVDSYVEAVRPVSAEHFISRDVERSR
jgi:hypothetical protein